MVTSNEATEAAKISPLPHLVVLECFRIGSVHCGKAYAVGNLEEAHK
jgi:hypothetical protein